MTTRPQLSNLDALHTNSATFVLSGSVSRLSRNTGNDSYSPWDFDDSDDGVVSNPLYEEPPLHPARTRSSREPPNSASPSHPLSLTIVPSPIDQSWIVTVQAEFTFRPEGVADHGSSSPSAPRPQRSQSPPRGSTLHRTVPPPASAASSSARIRF